MNKYINVSKFGTGVKYKVNGNIECSDKTFGGLLSEKVPM